MTHEFKKIVHHFKKAKEKGLGTVLASVVSLDGSSYRRPGVRMLLLENGEMVGAVSGGCVEKEVMRQAGSVFKDNIPKMMTYDGRYRLGCEGILYILLEPFSPDIPFLEAFDENQRQREGFLVRSFYVKGEGAFPGIGSVVRFQDKNTHFLIEKRVVAHTKSEGVDLLEQQMAPCFRLMVIGAEHDAVQLCSLASAMGWEVTIFATPLEEKDIVDFPGAHEFYACLPEDIPITDIDAQTAIVVMTHSYAKDLRYLLGLKETDPAYLGLLGPARRREKLLNELLERFPEVSDLFFDKIHGPAGINIGAETPQEIAISILAEILSVTRAQQPMLLKNKSGGIHS
jgi:xanthine/CO dehydrogenase XdhC/CoxF family maturation factor